MTIKLIGLAANEAGAPTEYDGKYVVEFDPAYVDPQYGYDGGLLLVADKAEDGRQFSDANEAIKYWRQSYGTRWDGEPNRPLTAYTVEIT